MSETIIGPRAARTHDTIDPAIVAADVALLFETIAQEGKFGICGLDVAYAVVAQTRGGIEAIYEAKQRPSAKRSGLFANADMSEEIHRLPDEKRAIIRALYDDPGLPFSVVAPYREDHSLFAEVDPFVMATSTKNGTLDMLMNAGSFHAEIARRSLARGTPTFGSSANVSGKGAKHEYAAIEPQVREAASIAFDYGVSKHANPQARASSIIDFVTWEVIRVGIEFNTLRAAFKRRFDVDLIITPETVGQDFL